MKMDDNIIFRETQRIRQFWVWGMILLSTAYMWYWFIQQIIFGVPVGSNPASDGFTIVFWCIFGVVLPILFSSLKLIVEVRKDGIYIRFFPFRYKRYFFKDISHYEKITYRPVKRFGGWGVRFNSAGEIAYNMSGNQGIKLKWKDRNMIIGTQKPDTLKNAIQSQMDGV